MTESLPTEPEPAPDDEPSRPVGRPRDPDVDRRILDAALDCYAELGWSGLTMERVAARAHTGKTSLYMRWPSKHDLLKSALASITLEGGSEEGRSVREILVAMALTRAGQLLGPHGVAVLRFEVEARAMPEEFADIVRDISTSHVLETRRWLDKRIRSGEIATTRGALEILEAIEGSAMMHALVTPPELVPRVLEGLPAWAERLVDAQLST